MFLKRLCPIIIRSFHHKTTSLRNISIISDQRTLHDIEILQKDIDLKLKVLNFKVEQLTKKTELRLSILEKDKLMNPSNYDTIIYTGQEDARKLS